MQGDLYNIVWMVGALILVGSALAAQKLSWGRSVSYMLIWAGLFAAVILALRLVGM